MSLLLDARKKTLQARTAQQDGNAASASGQQTNGTTDTEDAARDAGQNLFSAKLPLTFNGLALPDRRLLFGLASLVVIGSGATYYELGGSASDAATAPTRLPASAPAIQLTATPAANVGNLAALGKERETPAPAATSETAPSAAPKKHEVPVSRPVLIEHPRVEPVEPLLKDAYQTYRDGRLGEAQQLYQALLRKEPQHSDALLGLAAIAQRRGESGLAARYYSRVLALDPRNDAANAGMSALSPDDSNNESRLKLLLREQGNSAILHFALGNLYAGQSRWGEAQQAYFSALSLEPENAGFAYNLAVSLDHLGQARLASQYYRRAVQLDPSNSGGFDHAQVLRRSDDLER